MFAWYDYCLWQELARREDIVIKKEAMLQEKSELEIKKLRSSQMLSKVCMVYFGLVLTDMIIYT